MPVKLFIDDDTKKLIINYHVNLQYPPKEISAILKTFGISLSQSTIIRKLIEWQVYDVTIGERIRSVKKSLAQMGERNPINSHEAKVNLSKKQEKRWSENHDRLADSVRESVRSDQSRSKRSVKRIARIRNGFACYRSPGEAFVRDRLISKGYTQGYLFWTDWKSRIGYQMDFYNVNKKINIELDGISHNNSRVEDMLRDKILTEHGVKVIRIKDKVVMK